jgi:ribosomal protein S5
MINYDNIIALSQSVEIEETVDGLTAFAIYSSAKAVFEQLGISEKFVTSTGRELTSQNFYNFAKAGKIDGIKGNMTGRRFSDEDAERFIALLVAKATR